MDQDIRNKLRSVVTQCRRLLEDSVSQELEGKYSIFAKKDQVTADPNARMPHLTDEEQAARKDILVHFGHIKARGFKPKEALDQLVREIAFTHLNRLCAYKMMEAREVYVGGQKLREAVSRGVNSNGMKFYLAEHPDEERLFNTGHQDVAYRHFLDWLGGLLSDEIGVLFNPNDPANRLYPRQKTLDDVLDLLNGGGIKADETELREAWPEIWSQDETIGWVYQYFTPKELRDRARKESQAPRNSYELAFRNQFFTPRYVVEFLTDNTLGRIWHEMRKGDTRLNDQCRYMVRRPAAVFLKEGEQPPKDATEGRDDLSQDELLKLPVHIPHRPKKDPRELKILDPACGSGHFLLYCFDVLLTIYEEAYADPDLGPALQKDYPKLEELRQDVPRLILANNLHGIDIDLRAAQIAALALWLRCQRAYQDMGIRGDRPKINRSNIVCAEPMPGEEDMLKEFVDHLEPKLLGQLVEVVFDKMRIAGEAGSLLKIEEEIRDAVAEAKKLWVRESTRAMDHKGRTLLFSDAAMDRVRKSPIQPSLFDLSSVTGPQFFEQAEAKVVEALRLYADNAQGGHRLQQRLFTDDAVRGFGFVDACHKRFDVVLMNPPFGESIRSSRSYLDARYPRTKHDLFAAFLDRAIELVLPDGFIGELSSRVGFFAKSFYEWRESLLDQAQIHVLVDLGAGVLDTAAVEVACYVVSHRGRGEAVPTVIRLLTEGSKDSALRDAANSLTHSSCYALSRKQCVALPLIPFIYWVPARTLEKMASLRSVEPSVAVVRQGLGTGDNFRFIRAIWEVPSDGIGGVMCKSPAEIREQFSMGKRWAFHVRSGASQPWYSPLTLVIEWGRQGEKLKEHWRSRGESPSRYIPSEDLYFHPGLSWTRRAFRLIPYVIPAGCIPSASRYMAFPKEGYGTQLLGFAASIIATSYMRFYGECFERPNHLVDTFKRMPFPSICKAVEDRLGALVDAEVNRRRCLYRNHEPYQEFVLPAYIKQWGLPRDTEWNLLTLLGMPLEREIAASLVSVRK